MTQMYTLFREKNGQITGVKDKKDITRALVTYCRDYESSFVLTQLEDDLVLDNDSIRMTATLVHDSNTVYLWADKRYAKAIGLAEIAHDLADDPLTDIESECKCGEYIVKIRYGDRTNAEQAIQLVPNLIAVAISARKTLADRLLRARR